jgi:hypothetical protein
MNYKWGKYFFLFYEPEVLDRNFSVDCRGDLICAYFFFPERCALYVTIERW